jgi:hypothetical protein
MNFIRVSFPSSRGLGQTGPAALDADGANARIDAMYPPVAATRSPRRISAVGVNGSIYSAPINTYSGTGMQIFDLI